MTLKQITATILCALGATLGIGQQRPSGPGPGDPAPEFKLPGSDGKTYSLSDFAGRQAVIVAWFPKAFTGG
jgi:peroxiredoxin Q/BCP